MQLRAMFVIASLAAVILLGISSSLKAEDVPLAGTAYINANEAYAAFKSGDLATAAQKTKDAISIRPDNFKLRLLLIDVTIASGNLTEADALANEALSRFGTSADLEERRKTIKEQLAFQTRASAYAAADEALKAFGRRDYKAAVASARQAISVEPSNASYRLILVNALIAADDIDSAKIEVDQAIAAVGENAELQSRRRYIAERISTKPISDAFQAADAAYKAYAKKDYATAAANARKAIQLDPDNSSYQELLKNIERTISAPSQTQSRGEFLAQRAYSKSRHHDYSGAASDFTAALRAGLTPAESRNVRLALVDTYLSNHDPAAALQVLGAFGNSASYDVSIRRAYALQALEDNVGAATAFETAARQARNSRQRATAISGEISVLAKIQNKAEARSVFEHAMASGELQALPAADIANLALVVGDDRTALEYYGLMRDGKTLQGRSILNAGYIATRLSRTSEAVSYFEGAVDAYNSGSLPMDSRELFAVRRQISEMSRTWGAYASITYSKVGSGPNVILPSAANGGYTAQTGVELYWRPFGYLNGSVLDVFIRGFETPYSELGGTGFKTTQGMYGLRWKPIGAINWIVEAAQVFKIGDASRDAWLLRTAASFGEGTDLRVDVPSWNTWQFYADYNYFTDIPQNTGNADLRVGSSFRLDQISSRLVLFPHVGAFANYDDTLKTQAAYAVGAGATLRYWFREDTYHAPMSYLDITGQYRFRIAGDERAQGPFVQVLVSY